MKYLEAFLLATLAVFAPLKAMALTICVLVIVDLIIGVSASHKRKEKITSAGFKRTVGKLLLYYTALGATFLVQTNLIGDDLPALKIVSALIGLTELKSVLENLDSISGTSLFQSLVSKIVQSRKEIGKKP